MEDALAKLKEAVADLEAAPTPAAPDTLTEAVKAAFVAAGWTPPVTVIPVTDGSETPAEDTTDTPSET